MAPKLNHAPPVRPAVATSQVNTDKSHESSGAGVGQENAALHRELHALTCTAGDRTTTLARFRQFALDRAHGIGAFHVLLTTRSEQRLEPELVTGRIPSDGALESQLLDTARLAVMRQRVQIQPLPSLSRHYVVCAPVTVNQLNPSVLGVLIPSDVSYLQVAAAQLELVASYNRLYEQSQSMGETQWQLSSIAALCELTSRTIAESDVSSAARLVVNELRTLLGAQLVALSMTSSRSTRSHQQTLLAISGRAEIDLRAELSRALRQALAQTARQGESYCSQRSDDTLALPLRQVFTVLEVDAVRTLPLQSPVGELVGVLLLAGRAEGITDASHARFLKAATPHLSLALRGVQRATPGPFTRSLQWCRRCITRWQGWLGLVTVTAFLAALWIPVPYQVRCPLTVEPAIRRSIVSPINGVLETCLVQPGDWVEEGQLLARMDGREIRWELASVVADRHKSQRQRDIELAREGISEVQLALLEEKRLGLQVDLLKHREEQLAVKSPLQGIVLSADFEKDQNIPVDEGTVLFEVAPATGSELELEIPAEEVALVRPGDRVTVWFDGLGTQHIETRIERIAPEATIRQGKSVFVAHAQLAKEQTLTFTDLRPGMSGYARINGTPQPLGWNLFHKPLEWLISRASW